MAKQISKKNTRAISAKTSMERYFEAVGRRKTAVARVRIFNSASGHAVIVNNKNLGDYFPLKKYQEIVKAPFAVMPAKTTLKTTVSVTGGGLNAQAEAIRLGITRALIILNPELRPPLKMLGFLTRDQRMVERKKFGSRKARRPQQWRKR